jgi:hypothetical protein
MNAFNLNTNEYIQVNNNGVGALPTFNKVRFLNSFVITANTATLLPTTYNAAAIKAANDNLVTNAAQYCSTYFPSASGYACYISEMGVLNSTTNVNIPYAKVNVYAMDASNLTA